MATGVIGVLVLVFALNPPACLEYLVIFATGGLVAALFILLILGLCRKRGTPPATPSWNGRVTALCPVAPCGSLPGTDRFAQ